ncbi:MAG: hypothetical protein ACK5Z5_02690 [Neisseriaceae bacterium]
MRNLLLSLLSIMLVFVITTCAVTFSGKQHISYVANKPVLSDNNKSNFESNAVKQYHSESNSWFDNDNLPK